MRVTSTPRIERFRWNDEITRSIRVEGITFCKRGEQEQFTCPGSYSGHLARITSVRMHRHVLQVVEAGIMPGSQLAAVFLHMKKERICTRDMSRVRRPSSLFLHFDVASKLAFIAISEDSQSITERSKKVQHQKVRRRRR